MRGDVLDDTRRTLASGLRQPKGRTSATANLDNALADLKKTLKKQKIA